MATVHAVKGDEWPHVIVHEFNLFGRTVRDDGRDTAADQERNLLYIALTRAQRSLTLLLPKSSSHIPSPMLPIDIVHYAREMWAG